jgi:hypothetical protein
LTSPDNASVSPVLNLMAKKAPIQMDKAEIAELNLKKVQPPITTRVLQKNGPGSKAKIAAPQCFRPHLEAFEFESARYSWCAPLPLEIE